MDTERSHDATGYLLEALTGEAREEWQRVNNWLKGRGHGPLRLVCTPGSDYTAPFRVELLYDYVTPGWTRPAMALRFSLQTYPACCGITLFHSFSYEEGCFTDAGFAALFTAMLKGSRHVPDNPLCYDWRIELMMVTPEDEADHERDEDCSAYNDDDVLDDVDYCHFYRAFRDLHNITSVNSFRNLNSGNVVHRIEVLLNLR